MAFPLSFSISSVIGSPGGSPILPEDHLNVTRCSHMQASVQSLVSLLPGIAMRKLSSPSMSGRGQCTVLSNLHLMHLCKCHVLQHHHFFGGVLYVSLGCAGHLQVLAGMCWG